MKDYYTTSTVKHLYVVKFKDTEIQDVRPLTAEEEMQGWRETKTYDGKSVVVNEWHQIGSLHTRRASHVLAWEVNPGEEVVAKLRVDLSYQVHLHENSYGKYIGMTPHSASCNPVIYPPIIQKEFLVKLTSVLGRSVMLGEDGAEDAFGHNALHDHISAAINNNDWQRSLVACEIIMEPENDAEYDRWVEENKKWKVDIWVENAETHY